MANKDFMDPELTEEEKEDMIIKNEEDYLEGLLAAADDAANDIKKIDIIRNERKYFSFRIHSLSDEMLKDIRKKYTKYTKNRRQGIRVADELDLPKYRASLIYNSTTEEDQAKLWDNPAVKKGLEAKGICIINALDVIDAVLLPGEKDRIMDRRAGRADAGCNMFDKDISTDQWGSCAYTSGQEPFAQSRV